MSESHIGCHGNLLLTWLCVFFKVRILRQEVVYSREIVASVGRRSRLEEQMNIGHTN